MTELMRIGLDNAVIAAGLALLVALATPALRQRPQILHLLWLAVLVKLITPPLWRVPLPDWPLADPSTLASETQSQPIDSSEESRVAWVVLEETTWTFEDDVEGTNFGVSDRGQIMDPRLDFPIHYEAVPHEGLAVPPVVEGLSARQPDPNVSATGLVRAWEALYSRFEHVSWSLLWSGLGLVWLLGTATYLAVAAGRILRFGRLLRDESEPSTEVQDQVDALALSLGIRRPPLALLIPGPISPAFWAWSKDPAILIPKELWGRLDSDERRTLLAHELAHMARHDHYVRALELVVTGLFWWNPMTYWARARLRDIEESCCDALVLRTLPRAGRAYAMTLVATLDFVSAQTPRRPVAASGLGHVHHLSRRITRIMQGPVPNPITLPLRLALLAAGFLILPLFPSHAQDDPNEDKPAVVEETETEEVEIRVRVDGDVDVDTDDDGEKPATVRIVIASDDGQVTTKELKLGSLKELLDFNIDLDVEATTDEDDDKGNEEEGDEDESTDDAPKSIQFRIVTPDQAGKSKTIIRDLNLGDIKGRIAIAGDFKDLGRIEGQAAEVLESLDLESTMDVDLQGIVTEALESVDLDVDVEGIVDEALESVDVDVIVDEALEEAMATLKSIEGDEPKSLAIRVPRLLAKDKELQEQLKQIRVQIKEIRQSDVDDKDERLKELKARIKILREEAREKAEVEVQEQAEAMREQTEAMREQAEAMQKQADELRERAQEETRERIEKLRTIGIEMLRQVEETGEDRERLRDQIEQLRQQTEEPRTQAFRFKLGDALRFRAMGEGDDEDDEEGDDEDDEEGDDEDEMATRSSRRFGRFEIKLDDDGKQRIYVLRAEDEEGDDEEDEPTSPRTLTFRQAGGDVRFFVLPEGKTLSSEGPITLQIPDGGRVLRFEAKDLADMPRASRALRAYRLKIDEDDEAKDDEGESEDKEGEESEDEAKAAKIRELERRIRELVEELKELRDQSKFDEDNLSQAANALEQLEAVRATQLESLERHAALGRHVLFRESHEHEARLQNELTHLKGHVEFLEQFRDQRD